MKQARGWLQGYRVTATQTERAYGSAALDTKLSDACSRGHDQGIFVGWAREYFRLVEGWYIRLER